MATASVPAPAHTANYSQAVEKFNVWALHDKVKRWCLIEADLRGQEAVEAAAIRADRVRRSGQPCRFVVLPVGEEPHHRR